MGISLHENNVHVECGGILNSGRKETRGGSYSLLVVNNLTLLGDYIDILNNKGIRTKVVSNYHRISISYINLLWFECDLNANLGELDFNDNPSSFGNKCIFSTSSINGEFIKTTLNSLINVGHNNFLEPTSIFKVNIIVHHFNFRPLSNFLVIT